MLRLAVALSGLGGLLAELVWVRRFGLLLGNTSEASALVIGAYLLGLGIGGLLVPSVGRRVARPLLAAAAVYAAVAVSLVVFDLGLQGLSPLPVSAGFALLVVVPGIPTVLMGVAFPLVFAGLAGGGQRFQVGALIAANLAGSLVGTALGANWWLPELGFRASIGLAGVAYLGAAALLVVAVRRRGAGAGTASAAPGFGAPELPGLGSRALAAALSGALVVGLQILLLRRLPFFLEGFQPTLSGVLASVLLGLTLGSALGPSLLARLFGERALAAALALSALALNLGLHERVVPLVAGMPITSELALHARIWLAALVAAGPACFFLGAVVPLGVSHYGDPALRSVAAGRLFFWQGLGSIGGSLLVGHAAPWLWPHGFFVLVPPLLGLLALLGVARQLRPAVVAACAAAVLAASFAGWSGAGTPLAPEPPLQRPAESRGQDELRHLDHRTDAVVTASVAYDRSRHSMVLYTNEFRATETGPFADYMKVLGHLPFLLADDLSRVAVIAFGTGTTAKSVVTWPRPREIHLVEISKAVIAMAPEFSGDGPLEDPEVPAFLEDPRTRVHVNDGRRFLARQADDSLDLVSMEPLLPYSPGTAFLYTREFYELADRVLRPGGLLVQWVPTHALPADYFVTLLATFARVFPHTSVWFVDGATLLVGSSQAHLPDLALLDARLAAAPLEARVALHEAGIATSADVVAALLGSQVLDVVGGAPDLRDDRPFVERVGIWKYNGQHRLFHRPNYQVLAAVAAGGAAPPLDRPEWRRVRADRVSAAHHLKEASVGQSPLENAREAARRLGEARRALPASVLLHVEETLALRFMRAHEMAGVGRQRAGEIARKQLERDSGSAIFIAARALPTRGDDEVLAPESAAALAVAIEPTFFRSPPFYLEHLPAPEQGRSPLEDIGTLPQGAELAALAADDDTLAAAVRGVYRVQSARALIGVLAERPLRPEESRALAPLLDPALLSLAAQAVRARGGSLAVEMAPLARADLALPEAP